MTREINAVKKGQKNNTGKYRQVIFTLVLGKIMEQVILETVSGHMREKSIQEQKIKGFIRRKRRIFIRRSRRNHVRPS